MRKKLLTLLVLLMTAATGAWADKCLYLDEIQDGIDEYDSKSATLKCCNGKSDCPSGKPYYYNGRWYPHDYEDDNGNDFDYFKEKCKVITVDVSCKNFEGEKLEDLFSEWTNLETINDIGNLETSHVTNMSHMFNECNELISLDLSGWDTSNVEDMSDMFNECHELTSLNISGWVTSNVTSTDDMFDGCNKLNKSVAAHLGDAAGEYWATFYDVCNYQAPSGTQVFKVKLTGDQIEMTEIADRIVNGGEGVVLKSTSGSFTLTPTLTTKDYSGNSLQGTTTEINTTGANNYYVLNKGSNGVGFYKLQSDGTIGANKAYLTTAAGAREFFLFDDATGLKAIDNGQLTIDNEVYDLQGRRVVNPTKGLYIVNGKKVVIK